MHQPTIPAGPEGALICHLQYMLDHPDEGDNHNAEPFARCYRRMADLMPQLINEGCNRGSCSITPEIFGEWSRWAGMTSPARCVNWPVIR